MPMPSITCFLCNRNKMNSFQGLMFLRNVRISWNSLHYNELNNLHYNVQSRSYIDKWVVICRCFDNITSNLLLGEIKRHVGQILRKLVFITFLSEFAHLDRLQMAFIKAGTMCWNSWWQKFNYPQINSRIFQYRSLGREKRTVSELSFLKKNLVGRKLMAIHQS